MRGTIRFIAPYIGSKLVLAGRNLQPDKVYELIEAEGVTTLAGVPSLWNILVGWLEANDKRFSRLETMMSAGTISRRRWSPGCRISTRSTSATAGA